MLALASTAHASTAHAAPPLPVPTDLVVEPAGPTQATSVSVSWSVPDGVPAGATTHWALCSDADVAPTSETADGCVSTVVGDSSTSITIPTPDELVGTVWVWFELGEHKGPATRSSVVVDRTAPGPPTDVRWVGNTVSWQSPVDGAAPVTRVHWELCRGWGGLGTQCRTGDGPAEPFRLSLDRVLLLPRPGTCAGENWTLRLWLEDAAGNVDFSPGHAGGVGGSATPMCLPPISPTPPVEPGVTPARTSLAVSRRVSATGKGTKRRQRLTVTATTKPGDARGSVRIQVRGKQGKRTLDRTRIVRLANGRANFTLTVPKGFRRLSVRASYAGSEIHAPASRTSTVRIPRR